MFVPISPSLAPKLVLAIALLGAVVGSRLARAPVHPAAPGEVRQLIGCAVGLYAVGIAAWLTGRPLLGMLVISAGIATSALATWLARGDSEDPPDNEGPVDSRPPPGPDGMPRFDWARFEADLADYAASRRGRPPAGAPR
jgi:hypothetical protein